MKSDSFMKYRCVFRSQFKIAFLVKNFHNLALVYLIDLLFCSLSQSLCLPRTSLLAMSEINPSAEYQLVRHLSLELDFCIGEISSCISYYPTSVGARTFFLCSSFICMSYWLFLFKAYLWRFCFVLKYSFF